MRKFLVILLTLFITTSCVFKKEDKGNTETPPMSVPKKDTLLNPKEMEPSATKGTGGVNVIDKSKLVRPPILDTISAY